MPIVIEAVGTVQAIASIQIKSRIDSQIMKVNVEEGALVKEGDLLFELDARTLKAQLAQIEAQIRKDQAQIEQAKRDTARADDLLTKGAGTVVARDTNFTTQKAAEAQLESDEAMRQNILTQISYTEIRAPVSGRIGSIPNKAGTDAARRRQHRRRRCSPPSTRSIRSTSPSPCRRSSCPTCARPWPRATVKVNAVIDENRKQSGVDRLHREHRRSATPAR